MTTMNLKFLWIFAVMLVLLGLGVGAYVTFTTSDYMAYERFQYNTVRSGHSGNGEFQTITSFTGCNITNFGQNNNALIGDFFNSSTRTALIWVDGYMRYYNVDCSINKLQLSTNSPSSKYELFNLFGDSKKQLIAPINGKNLSIFEYNISSEKMTNLFNIDMQSPNNASGLLCSEISGTNTCYWLTSNETICRTNFAGGNPRNPSLWSAECYPFNSSWTAEQINNSVYTGKRYMAISDIDADGALESVFPYDADHDYGSGIAVFDWNTKTFDTQFSSDGVVDDIYHYDSSPDYGTTYYRGSSNMKFISDNPTTPVLYDMDGDGFDEIITIDYRHQCSGTNCGSMQTYSTLNIFSVIGTKFTYSLDTALWSGGYAYVFWSQPIYRVSSGYGNICIYYGHEDQTPKSYYGCFRFDGSAITRTMNVETSNILGISTHLSSLSTQMLDSTTGLYDVFDGDYFINEQSMTPEYSVYNLTGINPNSRYLSAGDIDGDNVSDFVTTNIVEGTHIIKGNGIALDSVTLNPVGDNCSDSDGGENWGIAGTLTYSCGGTSDALTDFCYTNPSTGETALQEFSCTNLDYTYCLAGAVSISCGINYTCSAGACIYAPGTTDGVPNTNQTGTPSLPNPHETTSENWITSYLSTLAGNWHLSESLLWILFMFIFAIIVIFASFSSGIGIGGALSLLMIGELLMLVLGTMLGFVSVGIIITLVVVCIGIIAVFLGSAFSRSSGKGG